MILLPFQEKRDKNEKYFEAKNLACIFSIILCRVFDWMRTFSKYVKWIAEWYFRR